MPEPIFSTMTVDALPFDKPGKFYRGNIHGHSNRSDGKLSPEDVVKAYRAQGYDFIAITDHFMDYYGFPITDTTPFRTDDFTTIIGAELHHGEIKVGGLWHILAVGLPFDFAPYTESETPADVVKRALDAGAYVAIPHPNWSTLTIDDAISLGKVHGVECFNGTSDRYNDRAYSWHYIDVLVATGHRISAPAVDDSHFEPDRDDFARGWLHVKAEELSPDALVEALKKGHFYSSTGPQIHNIAVTGKEKLRVECSPAQAIQVTGVGPWTDRLDGHGVTEHEFDISKWRKHDYFRVTVIDRYGARAWSNPIWFE